MCKKCDQKQIGVVTKKHGSGDFNLDRRDVLSTGASLGLATMASSLVGFSKKVEPKSSPGVVESKSTKVQAYGVEKIGGSFKPLTIERRGLRPNDVKIDILFAGICHSDIHTVDNDWGGTKVPLVPGHEIVGRVSAVGSKVNRFKVGDAVGVGCMVDSCGTCVNCKADREQNCLNGTTFTYGAPDKVSGGLTYGGYSKSIVVQEHFVLSVPKGMDLSRVAPIMCAGITTFSPMQHWNLKKDQKVGVIGIGGLGHMAVKLGVARGAKVTAFTTSKGKFKQIKAMGATPVLSTDAESMKKLMGSFDLLIATVPKSYNMQQFLNLLKLDATLVNVGQLGTVDGLSGMMMGFGRYSLAGSMIGGIAETQEVVDYCAKHNILPDVEVIKPNQIDQAYKRVKDKDIKFRFVIDMRTA